MLVLVTTNASAQCFKDMGLKKAGAFGIARQLAALQKQLKNPKCEVYGLRWREHKEGGTGDKGVLVFNPQTGELIREIYITKNRKQSLQAESWAGVSTRSLQSDFPNDGIDQKHYVRLDAGTTMVISKATAQFMRQSKLANFLKPGYVTVDASEPAEEDADTTTVAVLPSGEGAVDTTVNSQHKVCLIGISEFGDKPSTEARASMAICEEELQVVRGRAELRKSKELRFKDLLEAHLNGKLSNCLSQIAKLGETPSEDSTATTEACQDELKRRLARASDEAVYAILEAERDHKERLDFIWKIPNQSVRERSLVREERRRQREVNYIESCVKEIIDLGAKPSDAAIADWRDCQREKYVARSKAHSVTDKIEKLIVSTRDTRERRKLALKIPLKEMKQYWLSHIEREERLMSQR